MGTMPGPVRQEVLRVTHWMQHPRYHLELRPEVAQCTLAVSLPTPPLLTLTAALCSVNAHLGCPQGSLPRASQTLTRQSLPPLAR